MAELDFTDFMKKWNRMKERWKKVETYATMVFSTAHMPREDLEKLEACARGKFGASENLGPPPPLIVDSYPYGVRVYCHARGREDWEDLQERCLQVDIASSTMECITWGREAGCRWIEFDQDGPIYEEIQRHEW